MSTTADPFNFERAFLGDLAHLGPANYTSRSLEAAANIQGASQLYGCTISNTNASTQFFWFFDAANIGGANTSSPQGPVIPVAGASAFSLWWLPPRAFFAGIVIANSSSQTSFGAGAADCWFDVQYR